MTILSQAEQTTPEIHVGDTGTQFIATIKDQDGNIFNLSSATSLKFRFLSPQNESEDKTASLYTTGADGKMVYITEADTFSVSGKWKYQAIIEFASAIWYTNVIPFMVYDNIPSPTP